MLSFLVYFIKYFNNIFNINDINLKNIIENKIQLFLIIIKVFLIFIAFFLFCILISKLYVVIKFILLVIIKINKTIFNQTEFLIFILNYQYPNLDVIKILDEIPEFKLNHPSLMLHFYNSPHKELFFYFDKFIFYSISLNKVFCFDYIMFVISVLFFDLIIIFIIIKLLLLAKFNKSYSFIEFYDFCYFKCFEMRYVFIQIIMSIFIIYFNLYLISSIISIVYGIIFFIISILYNIIIFIFLISEIMLFIVIFFFLKILTFIFFLYKSLDYNQV